MKRCAWCRKKVANLFDYENLIYGDISAVCKECYDSATANKCRRCNGDIDFAISLDGLCNNCMQVIANEKQKRKEEVFNGVTKKNIDEIIPDTAIEDKDYEMWMTLSNAFTCKDFEACMDMDNLKTEKAVINARALRKIWINVKFNASGIYDDDVISKNYDDIDEVLTRSFTKLVGNKCKLIISTLPGSTEILRNSKIIDYKGNVYIISV